MNAYRNAGAFYADLIPFEKERAEDYYQTAINLLAKAEKLVDGKDVSLWHKTIIEIHRAWLEYRKNPENKEAIQSHYGIVTEALKDYNHIPPVVREFYKKKLEMLGEHLK